MNETMPINKTYFKHGHDQCDCHTLLFLHKNTASATFANAYTDRVKDNAAIVIYEPHERLHYL